MQTQALIVIAKIILFQGTNPAILCIVTNPIKQITMPPTFSEDEVDDILYFARTGDADFNPTVSQLCERENATIRDLLQVVKDVETGNGPLHMAAANGHASKSTKLFEFVQYPYKRLYGIISLCQWKI